MTQQQFSNLSQRLTESANADPFSDKHLELHGLYHAALTQSFDPAELADMEAQFDASQDYKHLAYSNF
jgi:hypothetical protein